MREFLEVEINEVKEVKPNLLSKLVALEKEVFGESGLNQWTLPIILRYGRVFTLKTKTDIIGLAELLRDWEERNLAFLVGFSIKTKYQGKGLGQKFLGGLLKILNKEGIERIRLTVSPNNKKALKLYQNLGFKEVAFCPNEYGLGEDRLLLQINPN